MPTHVVILGAGFGGLELSTRLSEELPGDLRVTLIDKSDSFVLPAAAGRRATAGPARSRSAPRKNGV
jgi:sulfide:quinone oxidoreductase